MVNTGFKGSPFASCKTMVNDTIANALDRVQGKIVPYNSDGIQEYHSKGEYGRESL